MLSAHHRKAGLAPGFQINDFIPRLHALKLRATFPRAVVLSMLTQLDDGQEVTPQELYLRIEGAHGPVIPMVACYRILGDFEKAGVVEHRYQVRDGRASVVYRRAAGQSREGGICLRCSNCRKRVFLAREEPAASWRQTLHQAGFYPGTDIQVEGLCEACHFPASHGA
jgi:Fe2+ or Zn2+ uptake regulation protein